MAQPGRPAAIAGDGVGGQCCDCIAIKARTIEPAAPSGLARWGQREQGGVAPDLADDLMAKAQGGADQRAAPVPGVEQQANRTQGADGAQQSLGHGELAGVAGPAAQAGDQGHRTLPARHHGGQRDEALAQQERRPLAAWSKRTATPGAWAEQRGASVYRLRRCLKTRRSRRSSAPFRSHVGRSGTPPRSGRATGTVRASSGRPASRAGASAPGSPG
jgi:hypothetical protein